MATKADDQQPIPTSWRRLREVAEAVHGLQDKHTGVRHDGAKFVVEEIGFSGGDYVITAEGKGLQKKPFKILIPGIDLAALADAIGKPIPPDGDLRGLADSIFWSLSAVQKFVLPYYASFKEPSELQKLVTDFSTRETVVAYIHLPNSEVVDDDTGTKAVTLKNASLFALVTKGSEVQVQPLI